MKIRIPQMVATAWNAFGDWSNVAICRCGRFELRRIDVLLVAMGSGIVAYYWFTAGWLGALQGGAMYVLVAMMALWLL